MQRLPVESSDIVSVGYDSAAKLLEVEFQGGRLYQYRGVDTETHRQFMRADSYGTFFFAHINGKYRYEKIQNATDEVIIDGPLTIVNAQPMDLQALEVACEQYGIDVATLDIPIDRVQSDDVEEVALKLVKAAVKVSNRPVVVSIVSWRILALRGFPGVYMPQMTEWLSSEDFIQLLEHKAERTISMTQIVAYTDGYRTKLFQQEYRGIIANAPRGEGSAIERIVQLSGQDKTIAELRQEGLTTWQVQENTPWNEFAQWLHMRRRFDQA